jgi:predicted dehydrogenase
LRLKEHTIRAARAGKHVAELDAFAARVLAGTPTTVPGEEGLRDVAIMTAIYEAARTGREVRLA